MNTPTNDAQPSSPSLPFQRPSNGDQYVEAARRANGAAAADLQAQRNRHAGTAPTAPEARNAFRLNQLEQIVEAQGQELGDVRAYALDDLSYGLELANVAIVRIDEWTAETAADVNTLQAEVSWLKEIIRDLLEEPAA